MTDSNEAAGERILWSGSVSHWHYAGRWFFVLVLAAALVASFLMVAGDPPMIGFGLNAYGLTETALGIGRAVLAVIMLILLVWIWVDRAKRKYTITDRRVSVEFGILSKNSNEVRIQDIRTINLTTKGLSGIFGIGRVEFSTAANEEDDVVFWNVPGAAALRDMVRSLQSQAP